MDQGGLDREAARRSGQVTVNRRGLLVGQLCMPAIVRPGIIMPVSQRLVTWSEAQVADLVNLGGGRFRAVRATIITPLRISGLLDEAFGPSPFGFWHHGVQHSIGMVGGDTLQLNHEPPA